MKRRSFLADRRGILAVIFVGVVTIMVATGTWLIAMLVASTFVDTFGAQATGAMTVSLGDTVRNQGAVIVVIIDVGMIVWMVVSAFARPGESQEDRILS